MTFATAPAAPEAEELRSKTEQISVPTEEEAVDMQTQETLRGRP